jgi:hypothetical protein
MTSSTSPDDLWYDPADYQSPYAENGKPLRLLLLALVTQHLMASPQQPQVDAMLAGLRVLLPQHSWWPSYHAYILCMQQRYDDAAEQVRGQTHPLAQLVRAYCAWVNQQATGPQELQVALQQLEPEAAALTAPIRFMLERSLLAAGPVLPVSVPEHEVSP